MKTRDKEKIKGILIYRNVKATPHKQICVQCKERIEKGSTRIFIPVSAFMGRVNFRAVHEECFKEIIIKGELM